MVLSEGHQALNEFVRRKGNLNSMKGVPGNRFVAVECSAIVQMNLGMVTQHQNPSMIGTYLMLFLVKLTNKWHKNLKSEKNEIYVTYEDLTFDGAAKLRLLEWLDLKKMGQPGSKEVTHMGNKTTSRNQLFHFEVVHGWERGLTSWPNEKFEDE